MFCIGTKIDLQNNPPLCLCEVSECLGQKSERYATQTWESWIQHCLWSETNSSKSACWDMRKPIEANTSLWHVVTWLEELGLLIVLIVPSLLNLDWELSQERQLSVSHQQMLRLWSSSWALRGFCRSAPGGQNPSVVPFTFHSKRI